MALLPQEPKQQRALLALVMVLGGAYAFHTYWYTPKADGLDELDARVEYLETRNRNAQIAAARGGADLEARIALYERHMSALEALIPASEEVPQLMRTISAQARSAGVNLSGLEPESDQPGEHYTKLTWRVTSRPSLTMTAVASRGCRSHMSTPRFTSAGTRQRKSR